MAGVFVPKIISEFLTEISAIDDVSLRLKRVKAYVYILEEELRKVDCFKRELPICMHFLKDAIERMKEVAEQCEAREVEPVMKEFLSMKNCINSNEVGESKRSSDLNDKKNWLRSAQLWSTPVEYEPSHVKPREKKEGGAATPHRNQSDFSVNKGKEIMPDHGARLTLPLPPVGEMGSRGNNKNGASSSNTKQKKLRRCWSPDLHKQFVRALEQLGGAQAATPKQIRDIMQVDGLTNDEVKSHLQKYRIHLRRLPSTSTAPPPPGRILLIPEDQSRDVSTSNVVHSVSPPGPLHIGGSSKAVSTTCGESMEEAEEDDKSENP